MFSTQTGQGGSAPAFSWFIFGIAAAGAAGIRFVAAAVRGHQKTVKAK